MTEISTSRALLPLLGSGAPKIIFLDKALAASVQGQFEGLLVLVLTEEEGGFSLGAVGEQVPCDLVDLLRPPTSCLALVGNEGNTVWADFVAWWSQASGQSAPQLIALAAKAKPDALYQQLAKLFLAETRTRVRSEIAARDSLARLRAEYEEVRECFSLIDRHLSGRSVGTLNLVSEHETGDTTLDLPAPGTMVIQPLSVPADRLAALAVHVVQSSAAARGSLRVRLVAPETQRILASWLVPFEEIKPGWLRLEMPVPLPPLRQSVQLELGFEVEQGPAPALSLNDSGWHADLSASDNTGQSLNAIVAHKAWTAEPGAWYVYPAYWDWRDAARRFSADGLLYRIGDERWRGLTPLDLGGQEVVNAAMRRFLTCPLDGQAAGLRWPGVALPFGDFLNVSARVVDVMSPPIEIGLAVVPAGYDLDSVETLETMPQPVVFSGWKSFDPLEDAVIGVGLPTGGDRLYDVLLVSRAAGPGDSSRGWVEWLSASVSEIGRGAVLHRAVPPPPTLVSLVPEATLPEICLFGKVELMQNYAQPDGYRHLAIRLERLSFGAHIRDRVEFKFARAYGMPGIEFRAADGEAPFESWPPDTSDGQGPLFRFAAWGQGDELKLQAARVARLTPLDRRFLDALIKTLPTVIAMLRRQADPADPAWAEWEDLALRFGEYIAFVFPIAA
jgi:hypothetical protein